MQCSSLSLTIDANYIDIDTLLLDIGYTKEQSISCHGEELARPDSLLVGIDEGLPRSRKVSLCGA